MAYRLGFGSFAPNANVGNVYTPANKTHRDNVARGYQHDDQPAITMG